MDNTHLRAIIIKLQDRLSDDDRKRLHFFFGNDVPRRIRDDPSLSGTLCLMESLFDQDKINEQDFTFLIHAFNEIGCLDAAKLLRDHMKRVTPNGAHHLEQSLSVVMPTLADHVLLDQDEEDRVALPNVVVNEKSDSVGFAAIKDSPSDRLAITSSRMNSHVSTMVSTSIPPVTQPQPSTGEKPFVISSVPKAYLLLLVTVISVLVLSLIGLIVGIVVLKNELRKVQSDCEHEQSISNQTIELYKKLQIQGNETNFALTQKTKDLEERLQITFGTTCGCQGWCEDHGSKFGVCGDGHTCICRNIAITKEYVGKACTCDEWCRKYGHPNGGVCGDGYTCLCAS